MQTSHVRFLGPGFRPRAAQRQPSFRIFLDHMVRQEGSLPCRSFILILVFAVLREQLYASLDALLILFPFSSGVRLKNGSGRWLRRKLAQVGHVQDFGGVLGRLHPSFARRRAAERLKLSRFSRGYPSFPFFSLPPLFVSLVQRHPDATNLSSNFPPTRRLLAHVGVFSLRRLLDHPRAFPDPPPCMQLSLNPLPRFVTPPMRRLNLKSRARLRGFNKSFPNSHSLAALSRALTLDMSLLCYAPYTKHTAHHHAHF